MGRSKKVSFSTPTKLLLCAVFICFVFYPFLQMVLNITKADFTGVIHSATFVPAISNSLKTALITTCISVPLGLTLALCVQRTRIRGKGLLSILLILPMLISSISHGMGLVVLFGTNGIIKNLLGFDNTIYGFTGIIVGSVLFSYPVSFLMFNDVLKYQDSSPYEAAMVLGISKFRQMLIITLPYLVKPLISAIFTVFTMVITDYGVPLMIGGQSTTLAVMMYQEVLGQLNFGKGSVVGLFLLIPTVISFIVNCIIKNRSKMSYVTKPFYFKKNLARDGLAYTFCGLVLFCIFCLFGAFFLIAFTVKYPSNTTFTFANIGKMFALRGGTFLINSLIISVFVSFIGVAIAYTTAYLTARMPSRLSSILHLFPITSLAIPGIVLGLSYALTFSGSFLYGTLAILILVNVMHFIASPYQMMYNSLCKMNENLESVGRTLGIGRIRMIFGVIIPQSRATIIEMATFFFVDSMMTISAVSFLANATTKPLSLLISQFEGQALFECASVVSLCILFINFLVKSTAYLINRRTNSRITN